MIARTLRPLLRLHVILLLHSLSALISLWTSVSPAFLQCALHLFKSHQTSTFYFDFSSPLTVHLTPPFPPLSLVILSCHTAVLTSYALTESFLLFLRFLRHQPSLFFQPHSVLISYFISYFPSSTLFFLLGAFFHLPRPLPILSSSSCVYLSDHHMSSPAWQLSSPCIMRTGKKNASW